MGDRRIRLAMVGLILMFPPLIEALTPGPGGSWSMSVARVALVELLVLAGLGLASRQRRRMLAGWHAPRPLPRPSRQSRRLPAPAPHRKAARAVFEPVSTRAAAPTA